MRLWLIVIGAAFIASTASVSSTARKFYDDDPLLREPETQDASRAQGREIDLFIDLAVNLFGQPGDAKTNVRSQSINSIDEVADSSWFTNRILAHPLSIEEAARGPLSGSGPAAGPWTIIRDKNAGASPGFRMRDARGDVWFVSFDAKGYPEAATSAIVVANKIFWTLGYWQVENYLATIRPDQILIDPSATIKPLSGVRRPFKRSDLDEVLRRSNRSADGSFRAVAARALPGRPIDGFYYWGTRPDDPNDLVPHEHRRELRALKVFGAWTNLVDMKAGNTLDTVVGENGRNVVRHYLQDVGSTFGTGAIGPHYYFEGFEYMFDGRGTLKRLASFGLLLPPWQAADYEEYPSIGRFEANAFDPTRWKPWAPTAAFLHARLDDDFWAARRVAAFSDDMIRALVATGHYSDPAAARYLASTLIKRRDAIARAFLPAVNPIVDPALDRSGQLTFRNAAVDARVGERPRGYNARWFTFDIESGSTTPIGETSSADTSIGAPSLQQATFLKVELRAVGSPAKAWERPISLYFRARNGAWSLVGLERLPDGQ